MVEANKLENNLKTCAFIQVLTLTDDQLIISAFD